MTDQEDPFLGLGGIRHRLHLEGIRSIAALALRTEAELLNLPRFNRNTVGRIRIFLHAHGLALAGNAGDAGRSDRRR